MQKIRNWETELYKSIVKPLIFRMEKNPEKRHNSAISLGNNFEKYSERYTFFNLLKELSGRLHTVDDERLHSDVFGLSFDNPVGLAAGYDKNAELADIIGYLGFGYAEIGSVTALRGDGNPPSRLFMLPEDKGMINRMGLNNHGADTISSVFG